MAVTGNIMEPWQIKQIESLNKIADPDWRYIDVGASVGEMLQYFVQNMGSGYAFEPDIHNYQYLKNNFQYINNLEIIQKAVSDKNDYIKFYNNGSHMGNILGHDMNYIPNKDNYTFIESITLDSFLLDKDIDFIKIDIEGAEWKLFDGAKKTLSSKHIVYQVEFHLDEDWNNREILFDNNYNIFTLDFKKLHHNDPRPYQAILINKFDDRFKQILER